MITLHEIGCALGFHNLQIVHIQRRYTDTTVTIIETQVCQRDTCKKRHIFEHTYAERRQPK